MKSIRVLLTDKCNENCINCLNRDIRSESTYMNSNKLILFSKFLRKNGVEKIRVMGGEPTLHAEFAQIAEQLQQIFTCVTVFTNGTSDKIRGFVPRENDAVNYNSKFLKCLNEDRLLCDKLGSRLISVVVDKTIDVEQTIAQITRVSGFFKNVRVSLSFDCTANIFKDRSGIVPKYKTLYEHCIKLGLETIMDHTLPICFIYGTGIVANSQYAICDTDCSGLVDSQFNLRFCNFSSRKKLPLFEDGIIIPYKIITNFLKMEFYEKQFSVLNKICRNCTLYGEYCNGGCFVQNSNISREDILQNTDFPTKTII